MLANTTTIFPYAEAYKDVFSHMADEGVDKGSFEWDYRDERVRVTFDRSYGSNLTAGLDAVHYDGDYQPTYHPIVTVCGPEDAELNVLMFDPPSGALPEFFRSPEQVLQSVLGTVAILLAREWK